MNDERAAYLKKHFPHSKRAEWHAPGPFTEEIVTFFNNPLEINLEKSGTLYASIDAAELDGNPFYEEIRIRFRLVESRNSVNTLKWGGMSKPLTGSAERVYYFTLSSNLSLEKNIVELQSFIAEHLEEKLVSVYSEFEEKNTAFARSRLGLLGFIIDFVTHAGALALFHFFFIRASLSSSLNILYFFVIILLCFALVRDFFRSPLKIANKIGALLLSTSRTLSSDSIRIRKS